MNSAYELSVPSEPVTRAPVSPGVFSHCPDTVPGSNRVIFKPLLFLSCQLASKLQGAVGVFELLAGQQCWGLGVFVWGTEHQPFCSGPFFSPSSCCCCWSLQRLDGSIKGEIRKQALDHFNAEGSEVRSLRT